jgi:multidrug transporter EmrE-like cation transporter
MRINYKSIALVILASVLATVAQILFKFASQKLSLSFFGLITNYELIVGFIIYALVAFIFVLALKGGELTILYPILAMNYVWTAIASPLFFPSDSLTVLKTIGIFIIILGVGSIGRGMSSNIEVA